MKTDVPSPQPPPVALTTQSRHAEPATISAPEDSSTDFMILPDGTLYARNLTPELAAILTALNPHDPSMALRATAPSL